jgi:hypothetical protein
MADQTDPFLSSKMQISTQFMQPIYLPSSCELNVAYVTRAAGDAESSEEEKSTHEIDFSLVSSMRSKKREHLRSNIIIN